MNELTRDQLRDERARVTRRVTLIGALINLVLSLVKMVIGYLAQSQALIADGLHSLSDLLSDGLVYFAAQHARQGPDDEHPYGHGRYETAATLGLGLLLVVVAVGILWDAVGRLFEAQPTGHPGWLALYAAIGSVLLKEWLYHYTMRAARRIRSDMMKANAWHHRSDSISTLVVLVGLAGTYAGGFYLDAIAAAVVGLMIARFGYQMAWEAVQELVDAGLDQERLNAVQERIRAVDGVRDLHMLRTRRHGGVVSADVHVMVAPRLSVSEGHLISVQVESQLKREFDDIEDVTVHVDPEDDENLVPTMGLANHREALSKLRGYWRELGVADCPMVLHYLNGCIEVDLFVPLGAGFQRQQAEQLHRALRDRIADDRDFGPLRLHFSLEGVR